LELSKIVHSDIIIFLLF